MKNDYASGRYKEYGKGKGRLGMAMLLSELSVSLFTLYLVFAGSIKNEIHFPLIILLSFAMAFFMLKNRDRHYIIGGFQGLALGLVWLRLIYYLDASITSLGNPRWFFFSGLAAAVLCALFFFPVMRRKKETAKLLRTMPVAFFVGMALYQAALTSNVIYDKSLPEYTTATVLEKSSRRPGRGGTRYYVRLELQEPAPEKKNSTYSCTHNQYTQLGEGDTVLVSRHAGLLGIPWLRVEQNRSPVP